MLDHFKLACRLALLGRLPFHQVRDTDIDEMSLGCLAGHETRLVLQGVHLELLLVPPTRPAFLLPLDLLQVSRLLGVLHPLHVLKGTLQSCVSRGDSTCPRGTGCGSPKSFLLYSVRIRLHQSLRVYLYLSSLVSGSLDSWFGVHEHSF